ncbi:MAG: hypothetical protein RBT74_02320 [Tenuifilaceae bacterium]|jgi:hypothetical protein|nr:hypothetical protein [Tenuifilaceae bacterium]
MEDHIMKRTTLLFAAIFYLGVATGFAQLFPKIDKPTSNDMSLLVLQLGKLKDTGGYEIVLNNNATGWAPLVKGPDGAVIPFRKYDAAADVNSIFYSENLKAGEYTLIGFYHVYVDYGKLEEYKKEINNPNFIMSYEPYADKPYHIKQLLELSEPVKINLEAGTVKSLGNYAVKYEWVAGGFGSTDDRWKAKDDMNIVLSEPLDEYIARYVKTWRTPAWKKWNEKNPASPL